MNDGEEERAPSPLDRLDQALQLDFRCPKALGLGGDGIVGVGGDDVLVRLEGNLHVFKRCVANVLCLVFLVREEDVGQVNRTAGYFDRL